MRRTVLLTRPPLSRELWNPPPAALHPPARHVLALTSAGDSSSFRFRGGPYFSTRGPTPSRRSLRGVEVCHTYPCRVRYKAASPASSGPTLPGEGRFNFYRACLSTLCPDSDLPQAPSSY